MVSSNSGFSQNSTLTRAYSGKRNRQTIESAFFSLIMVDTAELFKQLRYAKSGYEPYSSLNDWEDEELWPRVIHVMYGDCPNKPTVGDIVGIVRHFFKQFTNDRSLNWLPPGALRSNVESVFNPIHVGLGPIKNEEALTRIQEKAKTSARVRMARVKDIAEKLQSFYNDGRLTYHQMLQGIEYLNSPTEDLRQSVWLDSPVEQQIQTIMCLGIQGPFIGGSIPEN